MIEYPPIVALRFYDKDGDPFQVIEIDADTPISGVYFDDQLSAAGPDGPPLEVCLDDETRRPISVIADRGDHVVWEPGWEHRRTVDYPDLDHPELEAMAVVLEVLDDLQPDERGRALSWLNHRFANDT